MLITRPRNSSRDDQLDQRVGQRVLDHEADADADQQHQRDDRKERDAAKASNSAGNRRLPTVSSRPRRALLGSEATASAPVTAPIPTAVSSMPSGSASGAWQRKGAPGFVAERGDDRLGAVLQHAAGEDGHQRAVRHGQERADRHQAHQQQDDPAGQRRSARLRRDAASAEPPSRPGAGRAGLRIISRLAITATKLRPLRKKAGASPTAATTRPASAGPSARAPLKMAELRRDGVGQVLLALDHVDDERLPGRQVDRLGRGQQERHHIDLPHLDRAAPRQRAPGRTPGSSWRSGRSG